MEVGTGFSFQKVLIHLWAFRPPRVCFCPLLVSGLACILPERLALQLSKTGLLL
jgi:hypothetical protein